MSVRNMENRRKGEGMKKEIWNSKRVRRCLAAGLILAMTVGVLAGCGKKEAAKKPGNAVSTGNEVQQEDSAKAAGKEAETNTGNEEAEGKTEEWSWPLPEQKELSFWIVWSNEFTEDPNELKGVRQIESNTNVHIDWSVVISQQASEKFGLLIASGDYPDLIRGAESYYTGGLVQAIADGVLYDLTECIPQYMPNYQALRTSDERLERDTKTDDGRLAGAYTIASDYGVIQGENSWGGLCIRQDWLEECKLPVPETIADWEKVLTVFRDTYGCEAPLLTGSENGYDVCHNFLTAYGVLGEFYRENNTVKYGPLEDGYREWVELFRKWYADGLLDPNFISNDANVISSPDYIATGRAGAGANVWGKTADIRKQEGFSEKEDFFLLAVKAPVLEQGAKSQIGCAMSELAKETVAITKNCQDVELACRWLDYWYSEEGMYLDSLGIENESYERDANGNCHLTETVKERVANGEYPTLSSLINAEYTLSTSDFGLYNWAQYEPLFEGNRAVEAYDIWNQAGQDMVLPSFMSMTEEELTAYNSLYTAIKTLVQENTIKFITGTKDMTEYDSFVAELHTYGIDDCIAYKQAALDRYNAR